MDLEDIIALTKAGFTKEEIMLLAKGVKDDGDKKDPEDKKDDPAASNTDGGTDPGNSDSKGSEPKPDTLTASIQKSNIKGVSQDTKPEQTAESILGGLINPITKE